jgi:hypothetical protein
VLVFPQLLTSNMHCFFNLTAYNHISGTIPFVLQKQDFAVLDLSHNRFSGRYSHDKHEHDDEHDGDHFFKSISLQVNRLSGPLAATSYSITRILDGNLFGCDFIPDEDEHADTYACGEF